MSRIDASLWDVLNVKALGHRCGWDVAGGAWVGGGTFSCRFDRRLRIFKHVFFHSDVFGHVRILLWYATRNGFLFGCFQDCSFRQPSVDSRSFINDGIRDVKYFEQVGK